MQIFEAIGWVVGRVMDTVAGAVKWAIDGAKQIANGIATAGKEFAQGIMNGWNAAEAGFSELANSVAGLTEDLYEGAGRAAIAVSQGIDFVFDKFGSFLSDFFSGSLWLELGPDQSLYHPHNLVQLLKSQGRHKEALELSEKLVRIRRNLYVHQGKHLEADPYTNKLLQIQHYRANYSPWNEAEWDHTHTSPWHRNNERLGETPEDATKVFEDLNAWKEGDVDDML